MLDHLSDPNPPEFAGAFHDRVLSIARPRRQRHRLALGAIALLPLVMTGGAIVYLRGQAGELDRVEIPGLVPAATTSTVGSSTPSPTDDIAGAEWMPTSTEGVRPIRAPLNILIAGVDRRPPGDAVTGERADTIAIVRIDPDLERVAVLSLPRDLWVGPDGNERRLAEFVSDDLLTTVVSSTLDLDINHYVEVDFDGFTRLIDLAGGITVPFETAVRDRSSGFSAPPGCSALSGEQALAYVRSRHLEALDETTAEWERDPRGDIGRIARQQDLIGRVYRQVLTADYGTDEKIRLLTDVVDDIRVDLGLDLDGLRAIFDTAGLIGPDRIHFYDVAAGLTVATNPDGHEVLRVEPATIESAVAGLLDGSAPSDRADPSSATASTSTTSAAC